MTDPGSARVALVTGASRGIGRAIALALGLKGWSVAVNYRGSREAALETGQLIRDQGGKAEIFQADISLNRDRTQLLQAIQRELGPIQLLVNNAGMAPRVRADLLELSEESFDEVLSTNLKGPFFLTQQVAKEMTAAIQPGRTVPPMIINIGSISAYTSSINRGEYCLSKAAMAMMTALFADRLALAGILVYEIRPGIIETDMTSAVHEKYDRLIQNGLLPLHRWGQPEDIARAVIALSEGSLAYSTGEVINVDGGYHIRRL
jgi:3-oxoacyl-[acyl-carrier protein] reductase